MLKRAGHCMGRPLLLNPKFAAKTTGYFRADKQVGFRVKVRFCACGEGVE